MSDSWIVSVGGRAYGPYSVEQIQSFAAEGRLIPQSLVAKPGDTEFRPAGEDPSLAPLFFPIQPAALAQPMHTDEPAAAHKFGRSETEGQDGKRAHFVIMADMKSGSIAGLEEEIFNLGPAIPILPQVWLVSSDMSVSGIRNILMQKLGKLDLLFVVDATRDKASWFNFSPEADTRIRRLWMRQTENVPQRAAS